MLKYMAIGASLAFAAAVQPGPFQAYLLSRVAAIGWRRTLPASLAPLLSDGPIAILALLVLGQLSPAMQNALRMAGGVLLLYLAWGAFRKWWLRSPDASEQGGKVPRTLFEGALVNILNPNPYLGWTLILGPAVVAAWQEAPSSGAAVVLAFYATMITTTAVLIFSFGSVRLLGPKFHRTLLFISSLVLAALGIFQFVICAQYLGSA